MSEDVYFIVKEIFLKVVQSGNHSENKMLRNELLILISYLVDKDMIFELDCQYFGSLNYDAKKYKGLKNADIVQ